MSPEEAQAQAMRAIEEAARAAEMAAQAAQLTSSPDQWAQSISGSNEAVKQAMGAMRMAEEARRVQEAHAKEQAAQLEASRREFERTMQELREQDERRAQEAARREAERKAEEELRRQEAERRAAEEASRQAAAQAAQAAAPTSAAHQGQSPSASGAATTPAGPQPVSYRENAVVRHTDGRGLYVVTIPTTWHLDETRLYRTAERRLVARAFFTDGSGTYIDLHQGPAGTRLSAGMKAAMAQYGGAFASVDNTNYASMPNPFRLSDDYITDFVKGKGGTDLYRVRDLPCPDLGEWQQKALPLFQEAAASSGAPAVLKDPFAAVTLRTYTYQYRGRTMKAAIYVRLCAVKDALGVENLNPLGLALNLGSSIGGAFKKRKRASEGDPMRQDQSVFDGVAWATPGFDYYLQGGTIHWDVCCLATIIGYEEGFEERLESAFLPLVHTFQLHPDVKNLSDSELRQESAQIQQATNREINAMNMRTQATLAAARQAQAAADARFESWQRQSDAHHQAFRERTNAQFNTGYGGSSAPDFSEAIRGVNTYTTSDGREVELDVRYDRAYENQAGDVIGGSGGFDPGADWTEIPRA